MLRRCTRNIFSAAEKLWSNKLHQIHFQQSLKVKGSFLKSAERTCPFIIFARAPRKGSNKKGRRDDTSPPFDKPGKEYEEKKRLLFQPPLLFFCPLSSSFFLSLDFPGPARRTTFSFVKTPPLPPFSFRGFPSFKVPRAKLLYELPTSPEKRKGGHTECADIKSKSESS